LLAFDTVIGWSDKHIDFNALDKPVHQGLVNPLSDLMASAEKAGFNLKIASGFRDFDRQRLIWNAKANGLRPVLDDKSKPIDTQRVSKTELLFSILRWSALPGTSRHHWGTDVDIYDASQITIDDLQLIPQEYLQGGPCGAMCAWLRSRNHEGFFWPYDKDSGGVAPEPWHLSFKPLSEVFEEQLTIDAYVTFIRGVDIELKPEILANIEEIFNRFIIRSKDIGTSY